MIQPCPTADLGCGAGNDSIWLARQGFQVTGFDCSSEAVQVARRQAKEEGLDCSFEVADLTTALEIPEPRFEFVYHWALLHHIFPEYRERFAGNVEQMLTPGGKQLCMCFHEADSCFEGREKYRTTPLGTTLYFSSEKEIQDMFASRFNILDIHTTEIPGKHCPHQAVVAWMEKPTS